MVKGLLIAAALLLGLIGIMAGIGATLPVKHTASMEAIYPSPRDSVYALITDVQRFTEWRSGLERFEQRPPAAGSPRWLEAGGDGEILFEAAESEPGRRHVTRIADPDLPFGGTWTFELEDAPGGTLLRITEDGEVYNPIFRFMSRFVFGHRAGIEQYHSDLAKRIGGGP
jgi:uncharacterized protein YndB with AHSA1/START domain